MRPCLTGFRSVTPPRAAAKAAYCEKYPLPQSAVRRVIIGPKQGYYISAGGHTHYYGGAAGRRVAAMAARADCEPIPDTLVPFERDGQLMWLGQRGVYPVGTTPDLFKASLERALQDEKTADQPAAGLNSRTTLRSYARD